MEECNKFEKSITWSNLNSVRVFVYLFCIDNKINTEVESAQVQTQEIYINVLKKLCWHGWRLTSQKLYCLHQYKGF